MFHVLTFDLLQSYSTREKHEKNDGRTRENEKTRMKKY